MLIFFTLKFILSNWDIIAVCGEQLQHPISRLQKDKAFSPKSACFNVILSIFQRPVFFIHVL